MKNDGRSTACNSTPCIMPETEIIAIRGAADDTKAAKPPTKPARRKNWYQKKCGEGSYTALVSAAKKWRRKEREGASFAKFCEKEKIPQSVLRRYIGHEKATGVKKTTGQGRPYSAQKLLSLSSLHRVEGKVNTGQIVDVFHVWKDEQLQGYEKDKRKRLDRFALYDAKKRYFIAKPSPTKDTPLGMTNNVHCLVLNGKHYCYMLIRLKIDVEYYDSNRYDGRRESNSNNVTDLMDVVAREVGNELHPYDNINYEKKVATGLPKQENDVDCGAFVLFYADCRRHRITIKPSLSTEEITNYRGVIQGYVDKAPHVSGER